MDEEVTAPEVEATAPEQSGGLGNLLGGFLPKTFDTAAKGPEVATAEPALEKSFSEMNAYQKMTYVANTPVSELLTSVSADFPKNSGLISSVQDNIALTESLDNLRLNETQKYGTLIAKMIPTSSDDVAPSEPVESTETLQMILENPVLAGQMTQIVNNMADPKLDVTAEDLTDLQTAAETLKNVATDLGPMGMLFDGDDKFANAKADLEAAYVEVGLTPQDANIAIEQVAVTLINDKLSTFDNFGDNINAGIDKFIDSFGKESFIGGMLISTGLMSEGQLDDFIGTIKEFISEFVGDMEWANFDFLGQGVASVDGLYDWVEGAIGIDTSTIRPAQEPASEPTPTPTPDAKTLADEDQLMSQDVVKPVVTSEVDVSEATVQKASQDTTAISPASEIGRNLQYAIHDGSIPGNVHEAAQQTASLNDSFGPAMDGVVMTPAEVREVAQTAPAVAANNQMTLSA